MQLEELTIGQARELATMFQHNNAESHPYMVGRGWRKCDPDKSPGMVEEAMKSMQQLKANL